MHVRGLQFNCDLQVSEETVLNDPAGIHLRAGPYFLIYSAAMSEEEENMPMPWPDDLKVIVSSQYAISDSHVFPLGFCETQQLSLLLPTAGGKACRRRRPELTSHSPIHSSSRN